MNILTLSNPNKTISNADISKESLKIVESLCSEESLKFGCCEASVLKLRIRSDESVIGETFEVSIQEGTNVTNFGSFTVYGEKLTADRCYRDIEAYNAMYKILNKDVSDWYNSIQFPITLKAFRDSFFTWLGITQETTTLVNDQMYVEKTIEPTYILGYDVIRAICEINGCFGRVGRDNIFHYVFLNSNSVNEIKNSELINSEYADFTTEYIDKLQIRQEEDDIGVIYGTGENCYIVQDNFLVYGKSSEELQGIASRLFGVISIVSYQPYMLNMSANIGLEIGCLIRFTTNGKDIYSYVLEREITGIQYLKDSLKANGEQYQCETVNSVHKSIIQLKGKTNVLKRTIEELSVTITDKEQGLTSRIEQTASSITSEIARAKSAEDILQTKINQTDNRISLEVSNLQKEIDGEIKTYNIDHIPTLLNYPAWDFTYNIPCDNTVRCENVPMLYTDEYYNRNARTVAFNDTTFISYRFMKGEDGKWYWREVADSEYSYVLQQVAELKIEADQISSTVTENKTYSDGQFSNLSSRITQTASQITSEVSRATNAEGTLSSRITQTADKITAEISRATDAEGKLSTRVTLTESGLTSKVSKGSIVSEINQTAETIKIQASKIDLVGIVNASVFTSKYATIASLNSSNARISELESDHVSTGSFDSAVARIGSLEADHVSIGDLNAVNANINSIKSRYLETSNLSSSIADLSVVQVKLLQIGSRRVGSAKMNGHTVLTWDE